MQVQFEKSVVVGPVVPSASIVPPTPRSSGTGAVNRAPGGRVAVFAVSQTDPEKSLPRFGKCSGNVTYKEPLGHATLFLHTFVNFIP